MRFTASPDDFLRGSLAEVGWHPAVIEDAEAKLSKGGVNPQTGIEKEQVNMMVVKFKITAGPSKGVTIFRNFPENFPTLMIDMLEKGFGTVIDKKKGFDADLTAEKLKGKTLDIHVIRGKWAGKDKNEIDGYRSYTGKE